MKVKSLATMAVPEGVFATVKDRVVTVKGPRGTLTKSLRHLQLDFAVSQKMKTISAIRWFGYKTDVSCLNTALAHIRNMITGVTQGFERKLEVIGVGYKVALQGKTLKLEVGFSHEVNFPVPDGIDMSVEKNVITVTGIDKQFVGETAAQIRRVRKPEPYKGKGIKYLEETIQRKAGKTSKS